MYGPSGYPTHASITSYRRRPILTCTAGLPEIISEAIREAAMAHGVNVHCYCIMPDHVHVVGSVQPGGTHQRKFIQSLKKRATMHAGRQQRLWQESFYDHVLRGDEDLLSVCVYVLNNPVRKGLAKDWREYAHCWLSSDVGS